MHPGGCSADASRGAFAPTYLPAEVEKQAEWILPVARGALNGSSVSSSPSSSLSRRRCFFAAKSDLHFQYNQFLPRDEYAIGRLWSTRNQNRDAYHHHDSYPPINPGLLTGLLVDRKHHSSGLLSFPSSSIVDAVMDMRMLYWRTDAHVHSSVLPDQKRVDCLHFCMGSRALWSTAPRMLSHAMAMADERVIHQHSPNPAPRWWAVQRSR